MKNETTISNEAETHGAKGSSGGAGLQDQHRRRRPSEGRGRKWLYGLLAGLVDMTLWFILVLSVSAAAGSSPFLTLAAAVLPLIVLVICIALVGGYDCRTNFVSLHYASEHLIAGVAAYLASSFLIYVVTSFGSGTVTGRSVFTTCAILFTILSLIGRRFFWFANRRIRSSGKFLAIVDAELGPLFYRDYLKSAQHQSVYYQATDRTLLGKRIAGEDSPVLTTEATAFHSRVSDGEYEAIVVAAQTHSLDPRLLQQLGVIHFEQIPVYSLESFYETYWSKLPLHLVGPAWPIETRYFLVQHSAYSSLKRFLDFLVALVLLTVISPVFLFVSIAILVCDGSPVFYSQSRTGFHGIPFTLHKFRTMRVGSDASDSYTREGDVRVTRIGHILRKTRLDELPQLWNVLRGDMSMIGPRAEWVRLVSRYEKEIPHYHFRHLVRPGITGWAQVNYPYGASLHDTLEKLSYDLYYIRNFSLRLDASVILKTLHVMFFGKGR
jgi:exopolysaccharide biosynthesis polyprenyl glycosylphosphotransferase